MLVIGLLSTKQEVEEIRNIAQICTLENRIRYICRMQKIKDMIEKNNIK
jgi:hypothetical protein